MQRNLLIAAVLVFAILFLTVHIHEGEVLRLSDRATISFEQLILEVKNSDVVIIGEVHDEPEHHQMELAIIKALSEDRKHIAIGLEMFRTDSQVDLDAWVQGKKAVEDFKKIYRDNWNQAWSLYQPILTNARDRNIPLIGLNLPDAIAVKIAKHGFEALSVEDKKLLPADISCNVDATYMAFIRQAYSGHRRGADKQFRNFCEAQMVWDKTMAWNLLEYRQKRPEHPIIVLAGVGHAWKRGIAAHLANDAPLNYKVILPLIPGMSEPDVVSAKDADYVVLR